MPTTTREERLERRIEELTANDPQFAAAKPDPAVAEALEQPGLRLPQIVQTVLEGYADRPALGAARRRVRQGRQDRTHLGRGAPPFRHHHLRRAGPACRRARDARLTSDSVQPGDRVCVLGFTSVDFTTIDVALYRIGAVSVPLQTSAAITQLQPIVAETKPSVIAASVEPAGRRRRADPEHRPRARQARGLRLPPRGRRPARGRGKRPGPAGTAVTVETAGRPARAWQGDCPRHRW